MGKNIMLILGLATLAATVAAVVYLIREWKRAKRLAESMNELEHLPSEKR